MITEADVRAALNAIVDPCSAAAGQPGGLQDIGLIRQVHVAQGVDGLAAVTVTIAVTEFGCMMGAPFMQEAHLLLSNHPGVGSVDVRLDDRFDWAPSDMEPSYRAKLHVRRQLRQTSTVFLVKPTGLNAEHHSGCTDALEITPAKRDA